MSIIKITLKQNEKLKEVNADFFGGGTVYVVPAVYLKELIDLRLQGAFIYLLLGENNENDGIRNVLYVGKTNNISQRMITRIARQEELWWDKVIVVKVNNEILAENLDVLEHVAIQKARSNWVCDPRNIQNNNLGAQKLEEMRDSVDDFFARLEKLLSNIGINLLETNPQEQKKVLELYYENNNQGIHASAFVSDTGTIILKKGSFVRKDSTSSLNGPGTQFAYLQRKKDLEKGRLKEDEALNLYLLQENIEFPSPSSALSYVVGYPISGPANWKVKGSNISLKEYLRDNVKTTPTPT